MKKIKRSIADQTIKQFKQSINQLINQTISDLSEKTEGSVEVCRAGPHHYQQRPDQVDPWTQQ